MADKALEQAEQLFEDEEFRKARNVALEALGGDSVSDATSRQLKLLVRKCNTHVPPSEDDEPAKKVEEPPVASESAPPVVVKPLPAVRHEWFQTTDTITFTFYAKNRKDSDVVVEALERSLSVTIALDEGKDFQVSWEPLFAGIDTKPSISVRPPKVEIVVKKATAGQWPKLELDAAAVASGAPVPAAPLSAYPATQQELKYPNSRGKDWNKFKMEEEEEKLEGDAALNKLFKDIYAKASDDNRRAMMKSFQESGGTVLSTNWADVGKRKVECEAPKGMEKKSWEQ